MNLWKILHKICENRIFVKFLVRSEVNLRYHFYALFCNNFRFWTFDENFLNLCCLPTISLRQPVINCCKAYSNQPKFASKNDRRTAPIIIFTARLSVIALCFRKFSYINVSIVEKEIDTSKKVLYLYIIAVKEFYVKQGGI